MFQETNQCVANIIMQRRCSWPTRINSAIRRFLTQTIMMTNLSLTPSNAHVFSTSSIMFGIERRFRVHVGDLGNFDYGS